jgi:hypothetical protein
VHSKKEKKSRPGRKLTERAREIYTMIVRDGKETRIQTDKDGSRWRRKIEKDKFGKIINVSMHPQSKR